MAEEVPELPTEPLAGVASAPAPALHPAPRTPFARTRYRFTTGLRAGELARVRDDDGHVVLCYRSFASVAGIVATLVSGIVVVAGLAATVFLISEGSPVRAVLAAILTAVFAVLIAMLVPRANVTLYDEDTPALTIQQRAVFPAESYIVSAPNGASLALLRRGLLARFGRNRWTIETEGRTIGHALEESFRRALVRKLLGKFHKRYDTNVHVEYNGLDAGTIYRRGADSDVLELRSDVADRRVCVALATVILGREP
jgi:hypothetical protein